MTQAWSRLEVTLPVSFVDWVSAEVVEWGSPGIEILDDSGGDLPPGSSSLAVFFPAGEADRAADKLRAFLTSLGPQAQPFTLGEPEPAPDVDWARQWQHHFPPLPIGEHLLILPPWEDDREADGRTIILLQPGLAFGTGHHPTTGMLLERIDAMDTLAETGTVLDIGCGSGILSLAAVRRGAPGAIGLDYDEDAIASARENIALNDCCDLISLHVARFPELPQPGPYALVLANVYFTFFQQHIPALRDVTAPGGTLLASGLQESEAELMLTLLHEHGFSARISAREEGWIVVEGHRQ